MRSVTRRYESYPVALTGDVQPLHGHHAEKGCSINQHSVTLVGDNLKAPNYSLGKGVSHGATLGGISAQCAIAVI
jgi:hypothetical protein